MVRTLYTAARSRLNIQCRHVIKRKLSPCSIAFARRKLRSLASVREATVDRGWRVPVRAYENVNDGEVKY